MHIALFHGYELKGSGSNEYTRYLSQALVAQGHTVHVICREYNHTQFPQFHQVIRWDDRGLPTPIKDSTTEGPQCVLHEIPRGDVYPVYLTDKQREGNVKAFINLTDDELVAFDRLNVRLLRSILTQYPVDILHCNHLLYQSEIARKVCHQLNIPYIVYPHGSCIEYTVKLDDRYKKIGSTVLSDCDGIIVGNDEMETRLLEVYPQHKDLLKSKTQVVGVGVDTHFFHPVSRDQRDQSIAQLSYQKLGGGKGPYLYEKLCHELDGGNLTCLKTFMSRYDRRLPDEDVYEKLAARDWSRPTLVFAGALTVGKGLQSLICALPAIAQKIPDVQLVIIGSGAYRETLEALIHALETRDLKLLRTLSARGFDLDDNDLTGPWEDVVAYIDNAPNLDILFDHGKNLSERIVFTGYIPHDALKHLFPCADLAVFPSVVPEAYPLVLMEALSNGLIPVVSDFRGFRSGLNELAKFFDPAIHECMKIPMDPDTRIPSLVDHVASLLQNPKIFEMQQNLHQIAVDNYDWSLRAQQMVEAYDRVRHPPLDNHKVA